MTPQQGHEVQAYGPVRLFSIALAHDAAKRVSETGDDGTNDRIVSDIIRADELQAWFLAEHLMNTPLARG